MLNVTFSTAKQIKALLDIEERTLASKCVTMENLFSPSSSSTCWSKPTEEVPLEPTKLTIQSGDKTFEYLSLDEIFEKVVVEEDLINRNAPDVRPTDALSNMNHQIPVEVNKRLAGGLQKIQDYYDYRRKHREISQSSADFLTGLENLAASSNQNHDPTAVSALFSHLTTSSQRLKERTPLRFSSEPTDECEPPSPLIEQIQDILDLSLNVDFDEITADTPRLPSILHTANVLKNIQRPERLVFIRNSTDGALDLVMNR